MSIAKPTLDIPKEPAVRREWVMYQLRLRGLSLRKLASREGVHPQAISNALMTPNAHLEPVIAAAIGVKQRDLFPERFDDHGHRIPRTRSPQRTSARPHRNAKHEEAA